MSGIDKKEKKTYGGMSPDELEAAKLAASKYLPENQTPTIPKEQSFSVVREVGNVIHPEIDSQFCFFIGGKKMPLKENVVMECKNLPGETDWLCEFKYEYDKERGITLKMQTESGLLVIVEVPVNTEIFFRNTDGMILGDRFVRFNETGNNIPYSKLDAHTTRGYKRHPYGSNRYGK